MDYFSDRERPPPPPTITEFTNASWRGVAAAIDTRIRDGSFGARYPEICQDGPYPYGTDIDSFWCALAGDIPELSERCERFTETEQPSLFAAMDLIEFCWRAVGKPQKTWYHKFFDHHHLKFDEDAGKSEFREDINRIFRRNGMAYELTTNGIVERLVPEQISAMVHTEYRTGDSDLDRILDSARRKYLSPNDDERRDSLQFLWDAWERIKTIDGPDKKSGVKSLLDQAAGTSASKFRATLEEEAKKLTSIGNSFQIRHSETNQERLDSPQHVDYVACRMFSFIYLILRRFRSVPAGQSYHDNGDEEASALRPAAADDALPF